MMKKPIAAGLGVVAVAMAFAAKDPVIMTINGVDVPKSEFEYLYNKNSQQQVNPQTLDEYVEMFQLYKMKVEDAKAEGLDTLASFRKEIEQYKHDLAAPYLADSAYINRLVDEAYARSQKEVEAKHIMLFKSRNPQDNKELKARMDSLKSVLDAGGNFEELAKQYSQDRGSSSRGGRMGWILAGQYPYSFEVVDFSLPEGKISEVVESPVGYHILKGGKSRPARGKVKVAHILKLTQGKEENKPAAKAAIDSLYNIVKGHPEKFAQTATESSEDPGSARQGGQLPWFGAGEMVEQFDSVAFALKDGEISAPFETPYGYHIIYRMESKPVESKEAQKRKLLSKFNSPQDERYKMIQDAQTAKYASKHKAKVNEKTLAALKAAAATNGLDSLFFATWTAAPLGNGTILSVDGKNYPVSALVASFNGIKQPNAEMAQNLIQDNLDTFLRDKVMTAEEDLLAKNQPEYRNLLKEYIDGSLLYEVSVRKVWDKAAKDTEGLEKYFREHRGEYTWDKPYVKGYFVQTTTDSVADLVRARAAQLSDADMVSTLNKEFKNVMTIEKILIAKGGNAMVDYIAFNGPKVEGQSQRYPVYFMINERVITAPEEAADVKGLVTTDYQNMHQAAWEQELRGKYPVVVNEKVLKQIKKK